MLFSNLDIEILQFGLQRERRRITTEDLLGHENVNEVIVEGELESQYD